MKAYDEIMDALAFFFGDGDMLQPSEDNIREIISQEDDPIGTIAAALDDYREMQKEEN